MGRDHLVRVARVPQVVEEERDISRPAEGDHMVWEFHKNRLDAGFGKLNQFLHRRSGELETRRVIHTRPDVPVSDGVERVPVRPVVIGVVVDKVVYGRVSDKSFTPCKVRAWVSESDDNTPGWRDGICWT